MSLDKAVQHKKEHRKPWYDARAFDPWCRNHGLDDYYIKSVLQGRKLRGNYKSSLKLKEGLEEWINK